MEEKSDHVWGHLYDLRQTLIRTAVILAAGFMVALCFYQPIIQFVTIIPFEQEGPGLHKQQIERVKVVNRSRLPQRFEIPADAVIASPFPDAKMEGNHQFRLEPGEEVLYDQVIRSPLLVMGPVEGIMLVFKACFWLSVALTAPIWGWVWLQFILPGIKEKERAILIPFLLLSIVGMAAGCTLAYTVTLPVANEYLYLFNSSIGQNAWTLNHYLNYVLLLAMGHAVAAEFALLLLMLVHFRLLSPEWLISKRRSVFVGMFILAAFLTPPDVLTQIFLAIPMMGIYEVAILYAKWREHTAVRMSNPSRL